MSVAFARRAPARSVAAETRRLLRAVGAVAAILLVINVAPRAYILYGAAPKVDNLRAMAHQLDTLHAGMVDEETGIRGYLATGSRSFLQPYEAALPVVADASRQLTRMITDPQLTGDLVVLAEARQRWVDGWATAATSPARVASLGVGGAGGSTSRARLVAFMDTGKTLFDAYRSAHDEFARDIQAQTVAAADAQTGWLTWSGIAQGVIAIAVVAAAVVARRRIARRITAPIEALGGAVKRISGGDLETPVGEIDGPHELVALGHDVDMMAARLREQMAVAAERQQQVVRHGRRLATVLAAAREVAGSLSLRFVMQAVASAALELGSDRVRIWLLDDDDQLLTVSFDSGAAGQGGPVIPLQVKSGAGIVGRAAHHARPIGPEPCADGAGTAVAVPLVVGGRVVGALECCTHDEPMEADVLEVVEALAGHAAGAVASAQLHEQTVEHAVTDALTRLPNRRAFDAEYPAEVERALRYGRPLSVISVDLDRFKNLNDRYGHAYGDLVLQQTSDALRGGLRETDRIYRLGGEEIAVVCPETHAGDAAELAERLRVAVIAACGPDAPTVTASFGIAELPWHAADGASLLAVADAALYTAKGEGRNQVAVASAAARPAKDRAVRLG